MRSLIPILLLTCHCALAQTDLPLLWPQRCFAKLEDTQLDYQRYFPYKKLENTTLTQCLTLCAGEMNCSSAQYVAGRGICELFNVVSSGRKLIGCPGVDHHDITRPCIPSSIQPQAPCEPGKRPFHLKREGFAIPRTTPNSTSLEGISEGECQKLCTEKSLASVGSSCGGYSYSERKRDCVLLPSNPLPYWSSELQPSEGTDTTIRICVKERYSPCPTRGVGLWSVGMIIEGHALVILTTPDLETCLEECGTAADVYEFPCHMISYFFEEKECILNQVTKDRYPDLWVEDSGLQAQSIHIECDRIFNEFKPPSATSEKKSVLHSRLRSSQQRTDRMLQHQNSFRDQAGRNISSTITKVKRLPLKPIGNGNRKPLRRQSSMKAVISTDIRTIRRIPKKRIH